MIRFSSFNSALFFMESLDLSLIIGCILGGIIGYLIAKLSFRSDIKRLQQQTLKQSKHVTIGFVQEKIAPLLPSFPYNPKDLVFIGKGVDYLVFDGLHAGNLKQIVFLEIKTGKSTLNTNEQQIKNTIAHHHVTYELMRL